MFQTRQISKNLFAAISAQILSLAVSFILGFIVPRYINEFAYSYWQTFLLYVGYVNIFQFGLLDGFILRYSQYDYNELDKPKTRSIFFALLTFTTIPCLITAIISLVFVQDIIYKVIIILVAVGMVTKNLYTYTSYTFQSTNRINKYSIGVIIQRVVYVLVIVVCLFLNVQDFYWYCIAEIAGDLAATLFGVICGREIYVGKAIPFKGAIEETKLCVVAGLPLLIANLSSGLYIGSAKMVTQWCWDELIFGKVSFAFSLFTVFLSFTMAISVVLFPSLKRLNEEELPSLYKKIRNAISPILFMVMLLYFPMCWVLEIWLPYYAESLKYLGMLLPLIVFTSKVSLLTNNYLKIYRKEGVMLVINVVTLGVCFGGCLISAFLLNNLDLLIIILVLSCAIRSIVSEAVVMKIIGQRVILDFIIEIIMALAFILFVRYLSLWWACLAYGCALVVYAIIYRKSIVALFHTVINMFKRKKSVNE